MATDCKDCIDCQDLPVKHGGCLPVIIVAMMVATLVGLSVFAGGCSTAKSQQPAKSATMSNEIRDSVIIVAAKAKIPARGSTNTVIEVEGGDAPTVEILTLTQSLESSGSESFAQANTQTPTTDIKPDIDVRYNDALAAASTTSKGILETLTTAGANKVLALMQSGGSGEVTVDKADGTQAVVKCEGGQCTACTDCTDK